MSINKTRRAVLGAIASFVVFAALLAVERVVSLQSGEQAHQNMAAALTVSGKLIFADAVLTSSARLAAVTGDRKWRSRYDIYIPVMDAAIADARALATPEGWEQYDKSTRTANDRLIDFEERAFKFVESGDLIAAKALLISDDYENEKVILIEGNEVFTKGLVSDAKRNINQVKNISSLVYILLSMSFFTFLYYMWKMLNINLSKYREIYIESEEKLRVLATTDDMTGLYNRYSFKALLSDRGEAGSLLYIDLDGFKSVNDSLGHDAGDIALKQFARRLQGAIADFSSLLPYDQFVAARMGGDEFAVFVPSLKTPVVLQVAENILTASEIPYVIHGRDCIIGASIGVTTMDESIALFETALQRADAAMYDAKRSGKNQIKMHGPAEPAWRQTVDAKSIHEAIEENQFVLHYQPRICARTGTVKCLEALVRWNHPERGELQPKDFLECAARTGMIVDIDRWVCLKVVEEMSQWHNLRPDTHVSINLSVETLEQPDGAEWLVDGVRSSGLPPSLFEIEVTEQSSISNVDLSNKFLAQLRTVGMRIAIDDFGGGYANFARLGELGANTIKIDGLLTSKIVGSETDAAIVESLVEIAGKLQCKTVAEWVEDEEQVAMMRLLGCDELQGFYFTPGLPLEQLVEWMSTHDVSVLKSIVAENSPPALLQTDAGKVA